jgi:hypothetical protein
MHVVRDAEGRLVARSRTLVPAHRRSRTRALVGGSVNRAGARFTSTHGARYEFALMGLAFGTETDAVMESLPNGVGGQMQPNGDLILFSEGTALVEPYGRGRFQVVRVVDDRRVEKLRDFGSNEHAARSFARHWNG